MINKTTATVYVGDKSKRRYLTLNACCDAEARAIIKERYPTEKSHFDESGRLEDPGFSWQQLKRSDVMYRRLAKKIKSNYVKSKITATN
jgi:hypothetical protein